MPSKAEIKQAASLKFSKFRQKYGQFIVEGRKSVLDLIHSGFEIAHIWGTREFMEKHEKVPGMEEIAAADYMRLSQFETPPGLMAVAYTREYSLEDIDL